MVSRVGSSKDSQRNTISSTGKKKLDRSESPFARSLFFNAPTAMAVLEIMAGEKCRSADLKIIRVNRMFEQICGLHASQAEGKFLQEIFPELRKDILFSELLEKIQDDNPGTDFDGLPAFFVWNFGMGFQFRVKCSRFQVRNLIASFEDASLVHVGATPETVVLKRAGKKGAPSCFEEIPPEISLEQALETELKKRDETLRGIFDAIDAAIVFVDGTGTITLVNHHFTRMFGYSMQEVIGKKYSFLPHDSEKAEALENSNRIICGQVQSTARERLYQRVDGTTFPGYISGRRLYYPDGSFWAMLGVITDISEKKKIKAALDLSKSHRMTLINAMPDLVFLQDVSGRFLFCNKSFKAFHGMEDESIAGKTVFDLMPVDMAERISIADLKALRNGGPTVVKEEVVSLRSRKQGLFESVKTPLKDRNGKIAYLHCISRNITEQKKSGSAMEIFRKELISHSKESPLAVIEMDLDFQIISWNHSAEKIFGYSDTEARQRGIGCVVPKTDRETVLSEFKQTLLSGRSFQKTARNVDKYGNMVVCDWYHTPFVDEAGQLAAFVSICQDITQQLNTEQALKRNEERYRELFDTMTSGVAVMTEQHGGRHIVFKEFNRAAEKITGKKKEDVLSKTVLEVFPGLVNSEISQAVWQVSRTGASVYLPVSVYQDDTLKLWVEIYSYQLLSGEIVAVFNDMTAKKRIEEALKSQVGILQGVINSIGDNLFIINQDYRVAFQNDLSKDRIGNIIDQPCHQAIFQSQMPCSHCMISQALQQNRLMQVETEMSNHKSYEITFSPFQDGQERDKILVLQRDITEKKTLQAETLRAAHLASIGELAAGVAHEINNPVSGIISIAEIMADQFEKKGGPRDIPERIINEGERISRIVNNLLSFSRTDNEGLHTVPVEKILENTLQLVAAQLRKDRIDLEVDVASGLPEVMVNDQEIQQVFLNIISNARYALNRKSVGGQLQKSLKIAVHEIANQGTTFVRTSFLDSGTGIPGKIIQSVTDPFFTTKPPGDGTGLGLSISHGIVKNHQGRMFIKSRENRYTKVYIDLPGIDRTILK